MAVESIHHSQANALMLMTLRSPPFMRYQLLGFFFFTLVRKDGRPALYRTVISGILSVLTEGFDPIIRLRFECSSGTWSRVGLPKKNFPKFLSEVLLHMAERT